MSKHTPGPWEIEEHWDTDTGQCPNQLEQRKTNAHLIAAAPDLLEACEAALARSEHMAEVLSPVKDTQLDHHIADLRAAIAKARGKQP